MRAKPDFAQLPRVTCALCQKEVDRVVIMESFIDEIITVKVWCHGDTDNMRLTRAELNSIGQAGIDAMVRDGGVAFATDRLASVAGCLP